MVFLILISNLFYNYFPQFIFCNIDSEILRHICIRNVLKETWPLHNIELNKNREWIPHAFNIICKMPTIDASLCREQNFVTILSRLLHYSDSLSKNQQDTLLQMINQCGLRQPLKIYIPDLQNGSTKREISGVNSNDGTDYNISCDAVTMETKGLTKLNRKEDIVKENKGEMCNLDFGLFVEQACAEAMALKFNPIGVLNAGLGRRVYNRLFVKKRQEWVPQSTNEWKQICKLFCVLGSCGIVDEPLVFGVLVRYMEIGLSKLTMDQIIDIMQSIVALPIYLNYSLSKLANKLAVEVRKRSLSLLYNRKNPALNERLTETNCSIQSQDKSKDASMVGTHARTVRKDVNLRQLIDFVSHFSQTGFTSIGTRRILRDLLGFLLKSASKNIFEREIMEICSLFLAAESCHLHLEEAELLVKDYFTSVITSTAILPRFIEKLNNRDILVVLYCLGKCINLPSNAIHQCSVVSSNYDNSGWASQYSKALIQLLPLSSSVWLKTLQEDPNASPENLVHLVQATSIHKELSGRIVDQFRPHLNKHITKLRPKEISIIANSMENSRIFDPSFFRKLMSQLNSTSNLLREYDLSLIAHACGVFNWNDPESMEQLKDFSYVRLGELSNISLFTIIWSMCMVDYIPEELFARVNHLLSSSAPWTFQSIASRSILMMVHQIMLTLELRAPHIQLNVDASRLGSPEDISDFTHSMMHADVSKILDRLEIAHSNEFSIKGMSPVDIVIKHKKIAIEVDGPLHYYWNIETKVKELNGPSNWKQRMMESLGWKVLRLSYQDWIALRHIKSKKDYLSRRLENL